MNEQPSSDLIDEAELRAALLPWRPGREAFEAGVRQFIAQTQAHEAATSKSNQSQADKSDWLQTAAAVIPLPLLSNGAGSSLVKLGQLSFGKKIVALAAMPATGLLLMAAASFWAIMKVRRAQRGQAIAGEDATLLNTVIATWWRQFGLLIAIVSAATLLLMLSGHALPVFIVFLLSGMAMVGLINQLGKAGLVRRRTIAAALCPGLLALVQITHMATMFSHGFPFLDQMLIPAVLIVGALVMTLACEWPSSVARSRVSTWTLCVGLISMAGWFSSSLWYPVNVRDMKAYVEGFDHARHSSASWQQWQVPTEWLRETNVHVDLAKPRALVQRELASQEPNLWVLCHAIESGVLQVEDLDRVRDLEAMEKRVFDYLQKGRPFIGIGYQERILLHALVMRGELSETDRDFLAERLMATMDSLKTKSLGRLLEDQLTITKLSALIERPIDANQYRDFVHESLVSHQRLNARLGQSPGGFTMSKNLNFSDEYATEAAIELMQIYGVPTAVQIDALRSYLRPSSNDKWFGLQGQAYVRATGRQRLQSLPVVKPLTWQDYFRYEQNLIMAILFTSVCVLATLGAKK